MGSGQVGPIEQARDALDAGASWRARDLLLAHVEEVPDPAALTLLAEVLQGMGDLPRAGAMWFSAGAKGPEVDAAVAAWREQSHDDFLLMWRSLPRSVREEPRPPRVEALRTKALAVERDSASAGPGRPVDEHTHEDPTTDGRHTHHGRHAGEDEEGTDAAQVIAWVLAAVFVVLAVIGAVTVLGWVVPG